MPDNDSVLLPEADCILDASGLNCPLPLLKGKAEMAKMRAGEILQVIATDLHAPIDFQVFCIHAGHEFLHLVENETHCEMWVRKAH